MKIFFVIVLLLLSGINSSAQSPTSIGFHAGININSANGNAVDSEYKQSFNSFNVGFHFNAPLSKKFSLRTLLQYEENGWGLNAPIYEATPGYLTAADFQFKMNYISLYALPEYSFGSKLIVSLNAGPYVGFLVDNSIITTFADSVDNSPKIVLKSKSDYRKSINVGIAAGAGVQTNLNKKWVLRMDLRNNFGLSNVNNGSTKIRLNTFMISTGLSYRLQ